MKNRWGVLERKKIKLQNDVVNVAMSLNQSPVIVFQRIYKKKFLKRDLGS